MKIWKRIQHLLNRRRSERELAEELQIHRDMLAEKFGKEGLPQTDAEFAASRSFGNLTQTIERSRGVWNFIWLESLIQDVRYCVRGLRRTPIFAIGVIGTIGLALGLNTAIFTIFSTFVLKPISVRDPHSLYNVGRLLRQGELVPFTWQDFESFRSHNTAFSDAHAYVSTHVWYGGTTLNAEVVSGNYFDMLGVGAFLGRPLLPSDTSGDAGGDVAVLSYDSWKSFFASDPEIVGKKILLENHPFEIVGVAGKEFSGMEKALDVWLPLTPADPIVESRNVFAATPPFGPVEVMARLRPEFTLEQGEAAVTVWARQTYAGSTADVNSIRGFLISRATRIPLTKQNVGSFFPIFISFGLVLIVACANVANLMLARALARQKEIGIRLALGAGRSRLVRQLLVEGLILATAAGALSLMIARGTLRFSLSILFATIPPDMVSNGLRPIAVPMTLDIRVLGFVLAGALFSLFVFGLIPAIQATRTDLIRITRGDFASGFRPVRLRSGLAICQVTVCVLLLIVSGILLRGGHKLARIDTGLDLNGVVSVSATESSPFKVSQLADELEAEPSVESVATVWHTPLNGGLRVLVVSPDNTGKRFSSPSNFVSHQYFPMFRIPIKRGRNFTQEEDLAEAPVVVISEATARLLWPNHDALGQMIRFSTNPRLHSDKNPGFDTARVIGIVPDVISGLIQNGVDTSCIYLPTQPRASGKLSLLLRMRGSAKSAGALANSTLSRISPNREFYV